MYYLCKWYDNFVIFQPDKHLLSYQASGNMEQTIKDFLSKDASKGSWNVQKRRENIYIENNYLCTSVCKFPVICSLPTLNLRTLKSTHPHLFI